MTNDSTELTDASNGIERRRLLSLVGAAGVTGLAGCSGGGGGGGGGTTTGGGTTSGGGSTDTETTTTVAESKIQEGGTLTWGHSEVTQKLDVHIVQTAASNRFLNNIHETLVGLNNQLEVTSAADAQKAGLAADWEISDDRKTYTFTLRDGVKFHDGSTLTSADVKYTFDRIRNPDLGARYRNIIGQVDEVKTPDEKTVVLELPERYNPLIRQLAFLGTAIIPEGTGDEQGDQPVGTGPFKFESRQQGNKSILKAHEDYWRDGPYVDKVIERTVTDPTSRLTGVQEGNLDYINDIPLDNMKDVVNNDSDDLRTETWRPLAFNHIYLHNDRPPFDDQNWRLALDYMIDKQALVEGALFGMGTPIETPSYPNSPYRNNDLKPRKQDFEKARSLIEKSKYSIDEQGSMTFKVTTNYPWHVDAATIMQQFFNQAGLDVEIQKMQWGDWLSEVATNMNYRLAMVNWFGGWEPAQMYRGLFHSEGAFNSFAYASDAFDEAIEKAETAPSHEKEIEYYQEAQKVLHDEIPSPFLWFRDGAMASKQAMHGLGSLLSPDNTAIDLGQAWLDR